MGTGFTTGGGLIGRLFAPGIATLVGLIDHKLERGGIDTVLPDGSRLQVGFHGPGPSAKLELKSWMALVRLVISGSVGWYKAWELGEWTSPNPVLLFELFSCNATSLGEFGRAKGPFRWINALAHRARTMTRGRRRRISRRITTSATTSIQPGSTRR